MALPGRGRPAHSFIVGPRPSAVAPQTSTWRLTVVRPAPRRPPASRVVIVGPRQIPTVTLTPAARTVTVVHPAPPRPPEPQPRFFGPKLSAVAPIPWATRVRTFSVRTPRPLPRTLIVRQQQTPSVTVTANPRTVRVFAPDQPTGPRARPFIVGYGLSAIPPRPAARLVVTALVEGKAGRPRSFVVRTPPAPAPPLTPNPRTVRTFTPPRPAPPPVHSRTYGPKFSATTPAPERLSIYRSWNRASLPHARSFICRGRQPTPATFVRRVWLFHQPPPTTLQRPRAVWSNVGPRPKYVITTPVPRWVESATGGTGLVEGVGVGVGWIEGSSGGSTIVEGGTSA